MESQWDHRVLETDKPPVQEELDRFGILGFELVTIHYSPETRKWVAFFKRPRVSVEEEQSSLTDELPF